MKSDSALREGRWTRIPPRSLRTTETVKGARYFGGERSDGAPSLRRVQQNELACHWHLQSDDYRSYPFERNCVVCRSMRRVNDLAPRQLLRGKMAKDRSTPSRRIGRTWPETFTSLVDVIGIGGRDAATWGEVSTPGQAQRKDFERTISDLPKPTHHRRAIYEAR